MKAPNSISFHRNRRLQKYGTYLRAAFFFCISQSHYHVDSHNLSFNREEGLATTQKIQNNIKQQAPTSTSSLQRIFSIPDCY